MHLRNALFGAVLLGLLVTAPVEASQTQRGEMSDEAEATLPLGTGLFSARLSDGMPGFAWVRQLIGSRPLAAEVDLYVQYPVKEIRVRGRSLEDAILVTGPESSLKSIIAPEGSPPDGPGRPGVSTSTRLYCTQVTIGTSYHTADIEYMWEWRNTEDTTGDGKPDSNPDWVLVGMRVTFLPLHDAVLCN
jgi:hypothetical protein